MGWEGIDSDDTCIGGIDEGVSVDTIFSLSMTKRELALVDFYASKALVGCVCVVAAGLVLVGFWFLRDGAKPGSLREEVAIFYSTLGGFMFTFHSIST